MTGKTTSDKEVEVTGDGNVVGNTNLTQTIKADRGSTISGVTQTIYSRSQTEELNDYLKQAVAAYEARMYQLIARPAAPPDQPYKFLYAFEIEDANIFFGRDTATEELHNVILKDRLTVLHAKSGAGKTSLLNAGLSPRLIREGCLPVYARPYEDPREKIRWTATRGLGALWGSPEVSGLGAEDVFVRREAAEALGKFKDACVIEPLMVALQDEDDGVRRAAVEALGGLGAPQAVEPLIAALQNNNKEVCQKAAEILGKLGDYRAVEPLIAVLDSNRDWRKAAAEALGTLGDSRAVEPLIAALRDERFRVRGSVSVGRALNKIGTPEALAALKKYYNR